MQKINYKGESIILGFIMMVLVSYSVLFINLQSTFNLTLMNGYSILILTLPTILCLIVAKDAVLLFKEQDSKNMSIITLEIFIRIFCLASLVYLSENLCFNITYTNVTLYVSLYVLAVFLFRVSDYIARGVIIIGEYVTKYKITISVKQR